VFAGTTYCPEAVETPVARVCSGNTPPEFALLTMRSMLDGSEPSDVHLTTMDCVGSSGWPGVGEVNVKAEEPDRRIARPKTANLMDIEVD